MSKVKVIVGFDGAAPFSREGIVELGENRFEIRPTWHRDGESEEKPGNGTRFWSRFQNDSTLPAHLDCFINWEDDTGHLQKRRDRMFVLSPGQSEWSMIPVEIQGSGARLQLELSPGQTDVALSPEYNYKMALDYLRSKADSPLARLGDIGQSDEGRVIPLLLIDDPDARHEKKNFMFFARNHPYETAGSYCAEGMIDFLLDRTDLARYFRSKYRFHFLPMTNPDGVHNGLSRLTSPRGANVNRVCVQEDSTWKALKNYVDSVKPNIHLNIHNWQSKTQDGLLANTQEQAKRFRQFMPNLHEDGKVWYVEWTDLFLKDRGIQDFSPQSVHYQKCASWKDYVKDQFGGVALTLEFPWFRRTTARMRSIGEQALTAFLMTFED